MSARKFCCFGSLNIDFVYHLPHFVRPGETLGCTSRDRNAGGKGLNQSCALAHAGAEIYHAGNIGADGAFLSETLACHGVHTDFLRCVDVPTGHAVIQVDAAGENCIILFGGANQCADESQIDAVLSHFTEGDVLVLQNEVNDVGLLMEKAHARGVAIAFNPSPMDEKIISLPLHLADYLFVNETEGAALSGCDMADADGILSVLTQRYPRTEVVLTLGGKGAMAGAGGAVYQEPAVSSQVVDTTTAGDTFTGYYLVARSEGMSVEAALQLANRAASVTVSRKGAAASIPWRAEMR